MACAPPASTMPVTPARCAAARTFVGAVAGERRREDNLLHAGDLRGDRRHEDARRVARLSAGRVDADAIERADAHAERDALVLVAKACSPNIALARAVEAPDARGREREGVAHRRLEPRERGGAVEIGREEERADGALLEALDVARGRRRRPPCARRSRISRTAPSTFAESVSPRSRNSASVLAKAGVPWVVEASKGAGLLARGEDKSRSAIAFAPLNRPRSTV